ncbi:L-aspartate oxidase [hydrothermal vent metagenome]|uniref:L-aspartate oxidase n=1 Tax=hydrothermal vent metagenome TaxID=652676 RepID=A0A3B1DZZ1_9ZZZZ
MTCIKINTTPRYLVPFHPKRVQHVFTDVLVIGAGIAGLRAALEIDPSLSTLVVTKGELKESNSAYAQGGIAGVLDPLDDFANHITDTINVGAGLCDETIVDLVIKDAPERILELVSYGANFDQKEGEIALTKEGGHSYSRVAHALGDATGKEIMRAMGEQVRSRSNTQIWESTFTIDLLTAEGTCRGAIVWNSGYDRTFIWAKQTILATGGAGCLYRETTNPAIATADGHALAFRAGAILRDMEMMQFHPTVLYIAGGARHLISEAVRGEGAFLRNANGERFMDEYHTMLELAPRDIVSRAITDQIDKTSHPCVYLDLTHLENSMIDKRFPHIGKVCAKFGLDIHKDLIPVRPGAHYMIGGVTVDLEGRTSLPNLLAAGEVTSTGLHGANRLGSNSLLEGLVFGLRAGAEASRIAQKLPDNFAALPLSSEGAVSESINYQVRENELNLEDIRNSLASLMWRLAGIRRNGQGLQEAIGQIDFWSSYVSQHNFKTARGWELCNLLTTSRMLIASAEERKESRGVHFREDYPETNKTTAEHISVVKE